MAFEFALRAALEKLGYAEGRNLAFEPHYADGNPERLPALAKVLVQRRVDAIVAVGTASARAAKQATATIPIILFGNVDPVAAGLVASLARPGGNVTGVLIAPDGTLAAKKLELLKETVSGASRIAVLVPEHRANAPTQLAELRRAAAKLRIELPVVDVRGNDYAEAFVRIATARPHALFVLASTYFALERAPIIELTKKHRLPSMWEWREQVEDGGLMSYGSSIVERAQRMAEHIDRIFKGRAPGDLPVDRPKSFELAVNMKTAKVLGITIPPEIMVRATRVIQ
jgi:putative ABC transport system substrate-binding protein